MSSLWNRLIKKTVETGTSSSTDNLPQSTNSSDNLADEMTDEINSLSLSQEEVTLISSDKKSYRVSQKVARESQTIKDLIEGGCAEGEIPLPNVTGVTLGKIIEFCTRHVAHKSSNRRQEDLSKWDARFVYQFSESELFDLVLAAHYLNIEDLYELMCQAIADVAKTKTPDGILKMFNITKDTKFEI